MFGIKKYKHPEDYTFDVVHWGATASIVRLLEVCIEAGPQLILQLYIMMRVPRGNTSGESEISLDSIYTLLNTFCWCDIDLRLICRLPQMLQYWKYSALTQTCVRALATSVEGDLQCGVVCCKPTPKWTKCEAIPTNRPCPALMGLTHWGRD